MTQALTLREITPDNHLEVRALAVQPHQEGFVSSVEKSLADAYVWKDALARAAYLDEVVVGFILIYPFKQRAVSVINIVRLLIDAEHQGKGLGKELLTVTLNWINEFAPDLIRISSVPENKVALSLYKNMGFTETGIENGEVVLSMNIAGNA